MEVQRKLFPYEGSQSLFTAGLPSEFCGAIGLTIDGPNTLDFSAYSIGIKVFQHSRTQVTQAIVPESSITYTIRARGLRSKPFIVRKEDSARERGGKILNDKLALFNAKVVQSRVVITKQAVKAVVLLDPMLVEFFNGYNIIRKGQAVYYPLEY